MAELRMVFRGFAKKKSVRFIDISHDYGSCYDQSAMNKPNI